MQEEVESRTVTLVISATKLTGRVLKAAIARLMKELEKDLARIEKKRSSIPRGKQTVKQLVGQNAGVSNIEITDSNIKSFEKVARKYGVDYAVKQDRSVSPPKYFVFFKARDTDALTSAFKEFSAKTVQKARRPSVLAQLRKFAELVKNNVIDKVKHREQERSI